MDLPLNVRQSCLGQQICLKMFINITKIIIPYFQYSYYILFYYDYQGINNTELFYVSYADKPLPNSLNARTL